jgi:outer membrane protein OmpA-like peptidoglycan-associated protein
MADSMIDQIAQSFSPTLASRLASYGDSQSAVTKGIQATIPVILGMVTGRAHDQGFMSRVYALARDAGSDAMFVDDPSRLADRGMPPVRSDGLVDRFRSLIVGNSPTRLLDTIATYAGVQSSTASSILTTAAALVLNYLGKLVRRDNLDSAGLGRYLAAEHQSVLSAVPSAFSGILSSLTGYATEAMRVGADAVDETVSTIGRTSAWPWVASALAIAALWGGFAFFNHSRATEEAERAVGTAGAYATRILPGGTALHVPINGAEAKLLAYIGSGAALSRDLWVEFDRLNFETNSATLQPDSRDQLSSIADIMKAYPAVHLKIGGYTDNSGDQAANLALSQARAANVMGELVSMGVSADRLEAKGYGEEHPVATNGTEEGRAQNRRVAFQVTAY